ncbi:MAG: hypothetical protein CME67_05785 [Halobacteriovoraceae bacterium]|nr:hypothetical protein [Halobacteriovoraceae bacterium]
MENKTIGKLLKETRTKNNIPLEDVANKTKININILRALEKENIETLPNKTYVKGFVKNYAKTIGLDLNQAIEAYELLYKENEPEVEAPTDEEEPVAAKESEIDLGELQDRIQGIAGQLINKKLLAGIAAVLVLFFVVKGIYNFFSTISNEQSTLADSNETQTLEDDIKPKEASLFELENSKKIAADNKEVEETEEASTPEKVEEAPPQKPEAIATKEDDEVATNTSESKEEEPKEELAQGVLPFKEFYPAPRNLFTLSESTDEVENPEVFPERFRKAMDENKENLYIHALEGDTWLSYQVDGEDIKRFVLKKGKSLFLQAEEVILLFMGNFNAAKIFYNNKLVEADTRTGVKSLIFPEAQAANYEFPLFPSYKGVPYRQDVYKKKMAPKAD